MVDVTPAEALRKLVLAKPVPCDIIEVGQVLHPVRILDQFVFDGQMKELVDKLTTLETKQLRDMQLSQAIMIGTIQLSLRKSIDKNSDLVFPALGDAYSRLMPDPETTFKIFNLYHEGIELTETEKKS